MAISEARYEERLHPRGRTGRWVEKAGGLFKGVRLDTIDRLLERRSQPGQGHMRTRTTMPVEHEEMIPASAVEIGHDIRVQPPTVKHPTWVTVTKVAHKPEGVEITGRGDKVHVLPPDEQVARVHTEPGLRDAYLIQAEEAGFESLPTYDVWTRDRLRALTSQDSGAKVAVRISSRALPTFLDEGRVRNAHHGPAHEWSERHERSAEYESHRAEQEREWFHIDQPESENPDAYPVYGYVTTDQEDLGKNEREQFRSSTHAFGDAKLTLRDHVRSRTTITYSDSMYASESVIPSPIDDPSELSVSHFQNLKGVEKLSVERGDEMRPYPPLTKKEELEIERRMWGVSADSRDAIYEQYRREIAYRHGWEPWAHGDFFEAQIHGGVHFPDDVERVDFTGPADAETKRRLERMGIPYTEHNVPGEASMVSPPDFTAEPEPEGHGFDTHTWYHVTTGDRARRAREEGLKTRGEIGTEGATFGTVGVDENAVYLWPTRKKAEEWIGYLERRGIATPNMQVLKAYGIEPSKLSPDHESFGELVLHPYLRERQNPGWEWSADFKLPGTEERESEYRAMLDNIGFYEEGHVGGPEWVSLRQWLDRRPEMAYRSEADPKGAFWSATSPHDMPPEWAPPERDKWRPAIRMLREMPWRLRMELAAEFSRRGRAVAYLEPIPAHNIVEAPFEEHLHPRDRLGRWRKVAHGLHVPHYEAHGRRGSYRIEQGHGGKVWRVYRNDRFSGAAKTLGQAKLLTEEQDERRWKRDRLELLKQYVLHDKARPHEVWGGDPKTMDEGEYREARQRLIELERELPRRNVREQTVSNALGEMLRRATQERAAAGLSLGEPKPKVETPAEWPERGLAWEQRWHELSDDTPVWLFHATGRETAERMMREGIDPASKPMTLGRRRFEAGEYAEFQPGAGLAPGLTVGYEPWDVSGYGREMLAVRVRKGDVEVSPEQAALGATQPVQALRVNDAQVRRKIPASDIRRLELGGKVPTKEVLSQLREADFTERLHPRDRLGRWRESVGRLHRISKADVIAGRVPGFKYDPHISPGIAAHMYDREHMTLGPGAFRSMGKDVEHASSVLLAHEIGHAVGGHIIASHKDVSQIAALQAYRREGQSFSRSAGYMPKYENPFGLSERPEEILADAYSELLHFGLGEEPESKWGRDRRALLELVQKAARELGLPDTRLYRATMEGTELVEGEEFERLHPRGPGGKWIKKGVPGGPSLSQGVRSMIDFMRMELGLIANHYGDKQPEKLKYLNYKDLVLRHGKVFHHGPSESKIEYEFHATTAKECFSNALLAAVQHPDLTYVEGYAFNGLLPIHHAWLVDKEGRVHDPTWSNIPGREGGDDEYLGIPFKTDFLVETVMRKGTDTLLDWGGVSLEKKLPKKVIRDVPGTPVPEELQGPDLEVVKKLGGLKPGPIQEASVQGYIEHLHPRDRLGRWRRKGLIVVPFGKPGSGKGTLGSGVADAIGVPHVSAGAMLRDLPRESDLGQKVFPLIDKGKLVPDKLIGDLVEKTLDEQPNGIVLDGFPRTVAQHDALRSYARKTGRPLVYVNLDLPDEEAVSRLTARSEIEGRADDAADVIPTRMNVYREETRPVLDKAKRDTMFTKVNVSGKPIEENVEGVIDALAKTLGRNEKLWFEPESGAERGGPQRQTMRRGRPGLKVKRTELAEKLAAARAEPVLGQDELLARRREAMKVSGGPEPPGPDPDVGRRWYARKLTRSDINSRQLTGHEARRYASVPDEDLPYAVLSREDISVDFYTRREDAEAHAERLNERDRQDEAEFGPAAEERRASYAEAKTFLDEWWGKPGTPGRYQRMSGDPGTEFEAQHRRIMEAGAALDAEIEYRMNRTDAGKELKDAEKEHRAAKRELKPVAAAEEALAYEVLARNMGEGWTAERAKAEHVRFEKDRARFQWNPDRKSKLSREEERDGHALIDLWDNRFSDAERIGIDLQAAYDRTYEAKGRLWDAEERVKLAKLSADMLRRDTAYKVLSEHREMAKPGDLEFSRSSAVASPLLDRASLWLPRDWVLHAGDPKLLLVQWDDRRGKYIHKVHMQGFSPDEPVPSMIIGSPSDAAPGVEAGEGTMLHELVHRVEEMRDGVRGAEWTFYQSRVSPGINLGWQEPRPLREITGSDSYRADEMARTDDFIKAYSGKSYGDEPNSSYEILTMGIEDLVTGEHGIIENDPEYRQFVLGALITL